jgi:DNA-binding transcriptional regulator GbsR (MarR family)
MEENTFIDTVVKTASEFADNIGLGTVASQIYALLYVSQTALSLDEISEKLNLSKSTVSQNIRILEGWDAVKNVFVKGSRKDYYEVNPNIIDIVLKRLKSGLTNRLDKASINLNDINNFITTIEDKNKKDFYQQRIDNLKKMHETITMLVNTLPDKM